MFLTYETQSVLNSRFPKYDLFSTVNAAIGFNEIHSLLLFVEVKWTLCCQGMQLLAGAAGENNRLRKKWTNSHRH